MDCSIDDLLSGAAAECPRQVAVTDGDRQCGFAELDGYVSRLAEALVAQGVSKGDRVGICTDKSIGQVIAILAAARAGAVFVVISSKLKAEQADFICKDCQIRLLVADKPGLGQLSVTDCARGSVASSVAMGPWELTLLRDGPTFREISELAGSIEPAGPVIRSDLACLLYTSGSTGRPKGVMVTHGNLLAGAESVGDYLDLQRQDRIAGLLPFSFDYGLNQLLCSLMMRCRLVLTRAIFTQEIARTIHGQAVTVCAGVPPLWAQMFHAQRGVWAMAPFPSVRIVTNSGGKVSPPMLRDMERAFPTARIFLMYGLTEAFRSTYLPPEQLRRRPGSIGKAIPNAEVFLLADSGQLARAGEVGQIVHRGDTVARGYWNRPQESARVFRSHPFPTAGNTHPELVVYSGDYATRDEEGFLYYLGRRDQQLKVAGMRVSPEEIETVIASIDGVSECVVAGAGGDDNGDWIVAFVIAQGSLDEAGVLRACAQHLPRHMIPREVRLCPSFPRLDNGKTDRVALRDSLRRLPGETIWPATPVGSDQLGGGHGR